MGAEYHQQACGTLSMEARGQGGASPSGRPAQPPHRPMLAAGVGVLIGLTCCALTFNYNVPGSLETALEDDKNFTSSEVSLVLFFYSVPNTALSLFAGELIDRIGLTTVAGICMVLIQCASVLFALSIHLSSVHSTQYYLMIAARLLLGFGDCLGLTCMPALVARWFRHNHNGLAMGVGLMCIQIVGSAMSFFLLPFVKNQASLSWALWIGAFVAAGSGVFYIVYVLTERRYTEYLAVVASFDEDEAGDAQGTDPKSLQADAQSIVSRCDSVRSSRGVAFLPERSRTARVSSEHGDDRPARRSMWAKLRSFPPAFWLQNGAIFFTPVAQYISVNYMHYFLESDKYDFGETKAGICASVVYFCCLLAPLWGALCDRFGGRLYLQVALACVATAAFLLLRFTHISPWVLIPVLGVCFAGLEQNCYAVIDHLMPPDLIGFGYGVMGFIFNIGLGVLPLLTDFIHNRTGGYLDQNLLFAGWLSVGIVCSLATIAAVPDGQGQESGLFFVRQNSREWDADDERAPALSKRHSDDAPSAGFEKHARPSEP
eukprot:TRINITY_DN43235_c0_g1_i1.p1 TRINITY_DN43235_c0_g1~~TRINITY_DN43235_c0_g1_i1.p1  ORF type:complete len:559 (+),score=163.41 TRINITY_DN43235_c0_g1_i1:47-1678(+)